MPEQGRRRLGIEKSKRFQVTAYFKDRVEKEVTVIDGVIEIGPRL